MTELGNVEFNRRLIDAIDRHIISRGLAKTHSEVAVSCGFNKNYISELSKGKSRYSRKFLAKLIARYPFIREDIEEGSTSLLLKEPKPEYRNMNIEDAKAWNIIERHSETIHNQAETLRLQQKQMGDLIQMLREEQKRAHARLNSNQN